MQSTDSAELTETAAEVVWAQVGILNPQNYLLQ